MSGHLAVFDRGTDKIRELEKLRCGKARASYPPRGVAEEEDFHIGAAHLAGARGRLERGRDERQGGRRGGGGGGWAERTRRAIVGGGEGNEFGGGGGRGEKGIHVSRVSTLLRPNPRHDRRPAAVPGGSWPVASPSRLPRWCSRAGVSCRCGWACRGG